MKRLIFPLLLLGTLHADAAVATISAVDDVSVVTFGTVASNFIYVGNYYNASAYSYVKFDLSGLVAPSGYEVVIHSVRVTAVTSTGVPVEGGGIADVAIHSVSGDDSWSSSTITWANKPAPGASLMTLSWPGSNQNINVAGSEALRALLATELAGDGMLTLNLQTTSALIAQAGRADFASVRRGQPMSLLVDYEFVQSVPEPSTLSMVGLLGGVAALWRFKKRRDRPATCRG